MASILGLGGTANLTTTEGKVFELAVDLLPCQAYSIKNNDATNDALIRIPEMHGVSNWYPIKPGDTKDFICRAAAIPIIYGKSSASTVSISGGPTAHV